MLGVLIELRKLWIFEIGELCVMVKGDLGNGRDDCRFWDILNICIYFRSYIMVLFY